MSYALRHARPDGSFVIELRGSPYHVIERDPLFAEVAAAAKHAVLPAEPEPPSLPARGVTSISPRQLLLAMADIGVISEEEALAAAKVGAVPAAIETIFAGLPRRHAFAARVTWASMSSVERADPLVSLLGASQGMSAADLDAFFAMAATL